MSTNFNSYNNYNLVKLESVLQDVYRVVGRNSEVFTQDEMLESAAAAAYHLYNYKFYEDAVCLRLVDNYKATLPNYRRVKAVLFKGILDDDEYNEFINTTELDLTDPDLSMGKITVKDALEVKKASAHFGWSLAHPAHSAATMVRMNVEDNIDLGSDCNVTYAVKGCNMTLSKIDGYAIVFYDRILRDEEGCLLIPNVPMVNEAIRTYVLMEMQMRQANDHRDGSLGLYDRWERRWEKQAAVASAELIMPSLPEWINMVQETNRMVKEDPIERLFDTHTGVESINLGHNSHYYNRYY